MKWLGLRGDDLQLIPEQSLVPLKPRDLQISKCLMSSESLQVNYQAPQIPPLQALHRCKLKGISHFKFGDQ